MKQLTSLFSGLLFGLGLLVSGMTDPHKVRGFLDLAGAWDPSLAFVMIGAIGVHFVTLRLVLERGSPLYAKVFEAPKFSTVDAPLVLGSAIFGVGWGLGGVCPGPAVVTLGSLGVAPLAFVLSMIAGMSLANLPAWRYRPLHRAS